MPPDPTSSRRGRSDRAPRFSGLSVRLILAVMVFAVVMAGAYYGLVHRPLYEQLRGLDETEIRLLFRNLRNQLRLDCESAEAELVAIAELDRVKGFRKADLDEVLTQAEKTTTFYKKFSVLDLKGRLVSRPSLPTAEGLDRSDRGYFRGPLDSKRMFVDEVRPFGDGLSVSIGIPIFDSEDELSGVLAGHVELTGQSPRLCRTTSGWPSRSGYEAVLLSQGGYKIAHSIGPLDANTVADVDMRDHPLFALAGYDPEARQYSLGGVDYFGIVCTVPGFDWILLLQVEQEPILANVESAVNGIALVLGLVFVVLLGGVVFYGSRTIRPIGRLTSSLINFGRTGSGRPLDSVSLMGEIGDAIEAFNQMVVERSLAESELRRQSDELQVLANEMSRIEQRTRHEIAGELHDHISQALAAAKIRLELLKGRQSSEKREESLRVAIELLADCIASASQMTSRLAQPAVEQLGLLKALEALVAAQDAQQDVSFVFESDVSELDVDAELADIVYRGVAELLHNVLKHAQATRAIVRFEKSNGNLQIEVEDDGVGFQSEPQPPREGRIGGFGLFRFREQVRQIGGSLTIESKPESGCLVTVVVPMKSRSDVSREEIRIP